MAASRLRANQDGLASIIIVTVIITLLAIIAAGFAQVMDKEYHQAVDRELASQAGYAAESAMNDARNYVVLKGGNVDTGGQCLDLSQSPFNQPPFLPNGSLSAFYANPANPSAQDNQIKYTCVIISTHVPDITATIPKGQSKIIKVVPDGGATISNMYLSWNNTPGHADGSLGNLPNANLGANCGGICHGDLPQESSVSGKTGMLRATIFPAINGANTDTAATNNSMTTFLYPNFSGSMLGMQYSSFANGRASYEGTQPGNCSTTYGNPSTSPLPYKLDAHDCNIKITSVPSTAPFLGFYYVRLTALYQDLSVTLQVSDAANNNIKIVNSQADIDVTGEGNNTLKRLRARMSLNPDYPLPNYTLQSMDAICKRLRLPKNNVTGNPAVDYGPALIDDTSGGTDSAACQPSN